jgi:filamentous hemagglutinin family protein
MKLAMGPLCLVSSFFMNHACVPSSAWAQIVPDSTLPTPTQAIQSGNLTEISGGTKAGNNQFHSFESFSVPEGNIARFINNDVLIQNVIGRVTGLSKSEIFGRIEAGGVSSNFNLFLINPNGIIFGPQASLDLKGSFVATTANSIKFGNQGFFDTSTVNDDPSLLTVNPSAFFFNQVRPQAILNQALLEVPSDNSLILLGGNIDVNRGILSAPNGRVELGGLKGVGTVSLSMNESLFRLGFPNDVERADISLTNGSTVDVREKGIGSIALNGENIELSGRSRLISGISPGFEAVSNQPGEIVLDATHAVILDDSVIVSSTSLPGQFAIGDSGPIFINAGSLSMLNDSGIITYSFSKGNAGDITLNIRDGVTLSGSDETGGPTIGSGILGDAEGNGGNIRIRSSWLLLSDGIIRSTVEGRGNTGDISIHVDDFILLKNSSNRFSTQIRTAVEPEAIGNAGNIDIRGRSLFLTGGGQVSAAVLGSTGNLSGGQGRGGNISVNASNSVVISGIGANGFPSGIFADSEEGANGPAGNITISTDSLQVSDGAAIALGNRQGKAGNLTINANRMTLNNGILDANTGGDSFSSGANINLKISDLLRIENESLISAKASGNANGGIITIDTPILLALPPIGPNGSDIIAIAEFGKGGNITINAKGIFGITERKISDGNLTNDIDASSLFGRSGQVDINTATSPNNGLTELPETVVDPDYQVAQSPCNRGWGNELTVSGRGGLPPSPRQDLSSEATQVKLVEPVQASNGPQNNPAPQVKTSSLNSEPAEIVPAQGWIYNDKGQVLLVAYNPTVTGPQRLKSNPPGCPVP